MLRRVHPVEVREEREVGEHVIGAVHREQRVIAEVRAHRRRERRELAGHVVGHRQEVRPAAVALVQVVRRDRRAVRRLPAEQVAVDGGRHAAPHHGGLDAGAPQDLRHLRDVAEHVRQVAKAASACRAPPPAPAELQVADHVLAADEELVHQDLPRTDGERAALDRGPDAGLALRPDLEVVVDRRQLPVEREREAGVVVHHVEHLVDAGHEAHPEAWNGRYHSRSQWVCGTTWIVLIGAG